MTNKSGEFIRDQWRGIQTAFGFLTLISLLGQPRFNEKAIANSVLWYPLVGLVIGVITAALGAWLTLPDFLLATMIVLTAVALTGALHIDGLADCADAWVGGIGNRQRTLDIMKDPHAGTIAVTAIVLLILGKTASVAVLLQKGAIGVLLLAPFLARVSVLWLFVTAPYVGTGRIGVGIQNQSRSLMLTVAVLWLLPLAVMTEPFNMMALIIITIVTHWLLWQLLRVRLQGFTGDGAGALIEITELLLLFGGSLLWR